MNFWIGDRMKKTVQALAAVSMFALLGLTACANSTPLTAPEESTPDSSASAPVSEATPTAEATTAEAVAPAPEEYPFSAVVTTKDGFQVTIRYKWVPAGSAPYAECVGKLQNQVKLPTDITLENTGFTATAIVGTMQMTSDPAFKWPESYGVTFGVSGMSSPGTIYTSCAEPVFPTASPQPFSATHFAYAKKSPSNPTGAVDDGWSAVTATVRVGFTDPTCVFTGQEPATQFRPCEVAYVAG